MRTEDDLGECAVSQRTWKTRRRRTKELQRLAPSQSGEDARWIGPARVASSPHLSRSLFVSSTIIACSTPFCPNLVVIPSGSASCGLIFGTTGGWFHGFDRERATRATPTATVCFSVRAERHRPFLILLPSRYRSNPILVLICGVVTLPKSSIPSVTLHGMMRHASLGTPPHTRT